MKHVLLAYGYSQKNAGDMAITLGAIDILLKNDFSVSILSRYDINSIEYKNSFNYLKYRYGDQIKIISCPFVLDRAHSKIKQLYYYFLGILYLLGILFKKELNETIKNTNLVIFNGGNLLRCSSFVDYVRLKALFYPIKLAHKFKKEIIIFPQSTSHNTLFGKKFILSNIINCKIIFVREKQSYQNLQILSNRLPLKLCLDTAFFIDINNSISSSKYRVIKQFDSKYNIALTLRSHTLGDLYELPQSDIYLMLSKISYLIKCLFNKNTHFYIVIQCIKDKKISHKVNNLLLKNIDNIKLDLFEEHDPIELINFYKNMDILIGMRLHSIIMSLISRTPCIGIFFNQWGYKNPGVMDLFKMPYEILDNTINKNTINKNTINNLLINRDKISNHISEIINSENNLISSYLP